MRTDQSKIGDTNTENEKRISTLIRNDRESPQNLWTSSKILWKWKQNLHKNFEILIYQKLELWASFGPQLWVALSFTQSSPEVFKKESMPLWGLLSFLKKETEKVRIFHQRLPTSTSTSILSLEKPIIKKLL